MHSTVFFLNVRLCALTLTFAIGFSDHSLNFCIKRVAAEIPQSVAEF